MAKHFSTGAGDDREFIAQIFSSTLLEEVIDWIEGRFDPEQVFGEERIKKWAEDEGVENVFGDDVLDMWAKNNGYKKS